MKQESFILAVARDRSMSRSEKENWVSVVEAEFGPEAADLERAKQLMRLPPGRPRGQHRTAGRKPARSRRPHADPAS